MFIIKDNTQPVIKITYRIDLDENN